MKKCILLSCLFFFMIITPSAKTNETLFDEGTLSSEDYYLFNLHDQRIIFSKNENKKIFPASMTKIMTAIIVIENTTNYNKKLIVDDEDTALHTVNNASIVGFEPGEEISVDDALHGMLMASGADAAHAAAVHMAGSEEEFVKIMNSKAAYLGLENTHFMNCTGLHDDEHYTTLKDLSILFQYCMKNEKFKSIMNEKQYVMDTIEHPSFQINSYYKLLFQKQNFDPALIIGAKTGFTLDAGDCMISIAEQDGISFLFASAEAPSINSEFKASVNDAIKVYGTFLSNYKKIPLDITSSDENLSNQYVTVPKSYDQNKIELNETDGDYRVIYQGETIKSIPKSEAQNELNYLIVILCCLIILLPFIFSLKKGVHKSDEQA